MGSSLLQHRLNQLALHLDDPVGAVADFRSEYYIQSLQNSAVTPQKWNINTDPLVVLLSYFIGGARVRFSRYEDRFHSENIFFGHLASPYRVQDIVHLCFVIKGQMTQMMMDTAVELHRGDVSIVGMGCTHCEQVPAEDAVVIYVDVAQAFLENYALSRDNAVDRFIATSLLSQPRQCMVLRQIPKMDEIETILELLLRENEAHVEDSQQLELLLFRRLSRYINEAAEKQTLNFENVDQNDVLFDEVDRYIKLHLDNISVQDLERVFYYNRNFYTHLVRGKTGYTFVQYLQRLKMDRAKMLLRSTQLSVDEICGQIGYSNRTHFYALFRRETGVTPTEYRTLV